MRGDNECASKTIGHLGKDDKRIFKNEIKLFKTYLFFNLKNFVVNFEFNKSKEKALFSF
jgi:hypothetical protein